MAYSSGCYQWTVRHNDTYPPYPDLAYCVCVTTRSSQEALANEECTTAYEGRCSSRAWRTTYMLLYTTVSYAEKPSYHEGTTQTSTVSTARPLGILAFGILRPLAMTNTGVQFTVVMVNRFLKLNETTPTNRTTATTVTTILINDWLGIFGKPFKVLTNNGPQFTSKFFQEICKKLRIKQLTTKE